MEIPMSRDIACQLYVFFLLNPDKSYTSIEYDKGTIIFDQSEKNESNNRRN